jgi:hypothetical protein
MLSRGVSRSLLIPFNVHPNRLLEDSMRFRRLSLTFLVCSMALSAFAADARKPGLYETTSEMSWQKSPFPEGMQMPPQAAAAFGGSKQTTQVCVTQQQIDKYGSVPPQTQRECKMTSITKTLTGMKAEMVCSGQMSGKGTMDASWAGDGSTKGKVHFDGSMQMGPQPTPVEWTINYVSTYKGPDCGKVKPLPNN